MSGNIDIKTVAWVILHKYRSKTVKLVLLMVCKETTWKQKKKKQQQNMACAAGTQAGRAKLKRFDSKCWTEF